MHDRDLVGKARLGIAVVVLVGAVLSGCKRSGHSASEQHPDHPNPGDHPQLIVDESVAPDFETLAMETWDQFLAVFRGRCDCFGDVRLCAARTLDSRASYHPDTATVTVRVPGTPAMLRSALVHEWAHHVEFQCEEQQELRRPFLVAQGFPPDTQWRPHGEPAKMPASEWADIPSEQYAEATVALVLGARHIPTKARISHEAIRVIEMWARGN